ncbi:Butyryl-CoA dehydrogenase [Paraburkholderia saeva]|uniref:Butyryl-CoA dehydrogenase n=1 Tax=Paraburkholderia saeva TaxID=2777537 RepID=A0A9N8S194_9BURK|nr:Butyryl-CoA dehydrogenase [Paraburkholderia saeva]
MIPRPETSTLSLLLSRRDIEFILYEWLDATALARAPRYAAHGRDTFDAVLDTCERMATDLFASHYAKGDRQEPHFDGEKVMLIPDVATALKAFADAGLIAAGQDEALGGMQLPKLIELAGFAYFQAANIATAAYPFLTIGNANLLLAHGSEAQIDAFVRPEMEGRAFGTMCLSEPQAGSSLSDIATRADYEGESPLGAQYRLTGNKMWISGGDHELTENIVHLVLAKIPDAEGRLVPGTRGISLFIVPKYLVDVDGTPGERNDVVLAGLNHKMGYRGTTNCLMNFGEGTRFRPLGRPGAVGYRVGEAGHGLAYMFHMMNEARIGVGLGAVALGYTGYLQALDYARNRPQGRPIGLHGKDTASPQVRIAEHADVKRMLLAQKSYVEGGLALNLYCARLVDEERTGATPDEREAAALLLGILTPIAKSWPSQWCLAANDLAIQVHGGYGYTRDYKVEQLYRDNRLNPIHEGTHGIQALDLLGRKVTLDEGAALHALVATIGRTITRANDCPDPEWKRAGETLNQKWSRIVSATQRLWSAGDPRLTLANASVYLEAFGHAVLAWIWLDQALVAHGKEGDFYDGKRAAARYFLRWELPKIDVQLDLLESLDTTTLDMKDAWF